MNRLAALVLLTAWGVGGCDHARAPSPQPSGSAAPAGSGGSKVLASVNGEKITAFDVEQRLRASGGHSPNAPPVSSGGVLETVIRDELVRQRAVALGLDNDPKYQAKRDEMMAQVAAMERRELSDLFFEREVNEKVKVSDDDARKYFEENAAKVKSEVHVFQLLYTRDEPAARAALSEIRGGASFESVAEKRFPGMQNLGRKPWDLGYLRWNQMPEQWWSVVFDLKPGQVSDVIKGEDQRYWVLEVVERRELPSLSFDEVKARIVSVLKRERVEARRNELLKELREKAKIEYSAPAPPASSSP